MTVLKGRVILVTGASAGIGLAIAEALSKQGAQVIACARNIERVQELNRKLGHPQIYAVKTDLSKENEVLALFKDISQKFNKLDVLINNAGMVGANTGLVDGEYQAWKNIVDLNVLGLTLATREAVKLIESSGSQHGHIVNINSVLGHGSAPNTAGIQFYAASKHMVSALTEGLRKSVQDRGIRVTSLSPGVVETEIMERSMGKEAAQSFYQNNKILSSKDIADGIIYLLSAPGHVNIDELTISPLGQKDL